MKQPTKRDRHRPPPGTEERPKQRDKIHTTAVDLGRPLVDIDNAGEVLAILEDDRFAKAIGRKHET